MDERSFSAEIRAAWEFVKDRLDIGRAFTSMHSLPVDEEFRNVSLSEESTYEQIFRTGMSRSVYNILLHDYSFFQFTRSSSYSWRLGYFPNPWVAGAPAAIAEVQKWEALEEIGALTHEETTDLIDDMNYRGSIPPVRFEHAPDQYKELSHPTAHFHIGRHTENRWPCSIKIGPRAFVMLIAKMYYSEAWAKNSSFYGVEAEHCVDRLLIERLGSCGIVHDFTETERMSIHFGRSPAANLTAERPDNLPLRRN